jgi:hypothetical protein
MGRIFIFSILVILLTCCKKTQSNLINGSGTWAGSDTTCGGWLIRTSNNVLLEPLNLDSFSVVKKTGLPVLFTYYEFSGSIMYCLGGKPIELTSIADQ